MITQLSIAGRHLLACVKDVEGLLVSSKAGFDGSASWLACPLLSSFEYDHSGIDEKNDIFEEDVDPNAFRVCRIDPVPVLHFQKHAIAWLPAQEAADVQGSPAGGGEPGPVSKVMLGMIGRGLAATTTYLVEVYECCYFMEHHWGITLVFLPDVGTDVRRIGPGLLGHAPLFLYGWSRSGESDIHLVIDARHPYDAIRLPADLHGRWEMQERRVTLRYPPASGL